MSDVAINSIIIQFKQCADYAKKELGLDRQHTFVFAGHEVVYKYSKMDVNSLKSESLSIDGKEVIFFDFLTRDDMDDLIDVCVKNMVNDQFTEEQARSYMQELLPKLDYWKRYEELSDNGQFEEFKMQLINEINDLHIDGLPRVDKLNALVGKYVNLEYTLPNGQKVKFLDDQKTYLGNQLESEFGGDRCFGILASMDFILVCTYEKDGENPELVIYKKR